jgi:peptidoglycan biosynthesis protein MviN/MurJ (putative lipid II flippase)
MINLQEVVGIVLLLIVAGAVFGLLFWLVTYIGALFPGPGGQLFIKIAKVVLVVLAVVFAIAVLLSLIGEGPVFRWGPAPLAR